MEVYFWHMQPWSLNRDEQENFYFGGAKLEGGLGLGEVVVVGSLPAKLILRTFS